MKRILLILMLFSGAALATNVQSVNIRLQLLPHVGINPSDLRIELYANQNDMVPFATRPFADRVNVGRASSIMIVGGPGHENIESSKLPVVDNGTYTITNMQDITLLEVEGPQTPIGH